MRIHCTSLMLAACSLMLTAGSGIAQQAEEGVVQLGHRSGGECLSADNCDGCGAGSGYGYGSANGKHGWGPGGRNGRCRHNSAACRNGGRCGFGGNPHYGHCKLGCWLNAHSPYHRCTLPPDHGFAPPAHRPIYPTPAVYQKMFAGQAGGGAAADPGYRHPMVYMPTDTTQLGFYYQQVPFWQARAGMIPPVPQPNEWHTPDTGVVFTGFDDAGFPGLQGCPEGEVIDQGVVDGGTPVESAPIESYPGAPIESSPVPMIESTTPYSPEPVSPQMVPPVTESAPGAPVPPSPSGPSASHGVAAQDLEKSASAPMLIPVPPK